MYQGRGLGLSITGGGSLSEFGTTYVPPTGPTSGINWEDVISQAIDTAGHIIKPSAYPQYPVYGPTGAAAVGIANSPGLWVLGGAVVLALLLRRR
jgi:hypothetical protein